MDNSKTIEKLIERFNLEEPENKGYSYPRLESIGNIPTIIVDPHNEAFPFWHIKGENPATLVHIDKHPDTADFSMSLEELEKLGKIDIVTYTKYFQSIGSFISPAIFYDLIDSVYWINLREENIIRLGKRKDWDLKKLVNHADGRLVWNVDYSPREPPGAEIKLEDMIYQIKKDKPLILDIDLDAFEDIEDKGYRLKKYLSCGLYCLSKKTFGIEKRFSEFKSILKKIPRPKRITIARSETPIRYTPKSKVDYIEKRVLEYLNSEYS